MGRHIGSVDTAHHDGWGGLRWVPVIRLVYKRLPLCTKITGTRSALRPLFFGWYMRLGRVIGTLRLGLSAWSPTVVREVCVCQPFSKVSLFFGVRGDRWSNLGGGGVNISAVGDDGRAYSPSYRWRHVRRALGKH